MKIISACVWTVLKAAAPAFYEISAQLLCCSLWREFILNVDGTSDFKH